MAKPTPNELEHISAAAQRLWDLDTNRLEPKRDYEISLQAAKRFSDKSDVASEPLVKYVKDEVWRKPTYHTFKQLLDNYEWATGYGEDMTAEERREIDAFIDAIMETQCMRYCLEYVKAAGAWSGSERDFKQHLWHIWFSCYRRDATMDSSGFEHVFVGESDNGKISGFHNWITFHVCEQQGLINYKGVVSNRRGAIDDDDDDHERVITVNFESSDGESKDVSTLFMGTSPEFEMALYTMCFVAGGQERLRIKLEGRPIQIKN